MILTINTNSIDFNVEQPTDIFPVFPKKIRGELTDKYSSENFILPEYYEDTVVTNVKLFNQFSSIVAMESALHELFKYATIDEGVKTFKFQNENGSGQAQTFKGVVQDKIKVKYKKAGPVISVFVNLPIKRTLT